MSTLRGRIGAALLVFGLITLLAVGGTLWVALRDLHRDAALGSLTELTVPYAGVLRRAPGDNLGQPAETRRGGVRPADRIRAGRLQFDEAVLAAFIEQIQEDVDPASLSVILIQDEATLFVNPIDRTTTTLATTPEIDANLVRGQVATGITPIEGVGDALYAATPIRDPLLGRGSPLLVLAREDDSAQLASADLLRALTLAGLALLIVGIPIAVGLSASVTRPLRRLSAAAASVGAGKVPEPVPTTGPAEVSQASAAFNAMAAEVGATREAQRQLLADIRHDLRTPLTVIGGFSEALRDGTATGDDAVRAADAISDETGRLGRMLDDLDHLTVPGLAGPSLRPEALDSRVVAEAAVGRFAAEASGRGQSIALDEDAKSVMLDADRDALDRILGNIIANALGHAPSPGGTVTVEVTVSSARVTLAVRDDGPGIPEAALPHVFDRFYRADPSRTQGGSGLGLAIVSDLAEALGGHAFAESPDGGGARVGIVLPATEDGPSRARPPTA